jgi:syntaxin 1B/2/3
VEGENSNSRFEQMSVLVEQQDEVINTVETAAGSVEKDIETG